MILGVDFSLTSTGLCLIVDGEATCTTIRTKPTAQWWQHGDRVRNIVDQVAKFAGDVPTWVIESPSFASKGQLDRLYSGWWMVVDNLIHEYGWDPPTLVAPAQLKKYAIGKGGGPGTGKVEVSIAIARQHPDVAIGNDNEADALVLASIGAAMHDEPFAGRLKAHQEEVLDALRKQEKND